MCRRPCNLRPRTLIDAWWPLTHNVIGERPGSRGSLRLRLCVLLRYGLSLLLRLCIGFRNVIICRIMSEIQAKSIRDSKYLK